MQITVYSTATCPFCNMLKDYLDQKGLSYTEKLVDQDETAKEEMTAASGGFLGVPFTVIIRDDGTKETVVGFDKGRLDQVIGVGN